MERCSGGTVLSGVREEFLFEEFGGSLIERPRVEFLEKHKSALCAKSGIVRDKLSLTF